MDTETQYLTEEKYEFLEKELEELTTTRRKEVIEALEFAKSLGDLSENAEYHNARDEQGRLEDRIAKIEHMLRTAVVVKQGGHGSKVEVGSKVVLAKKGSKDTITYAIVGQEEADTFAGKISHKSPLGEALFGKKKGDTATITTPKGVSTYTILDLS